MAKTNKSNTNPPSLANECGIEERYRRLCTPNAIPETEAFLERVALELMNWAELDDSLVLNQFCRKRGFSIDSMERWAKKYPTFGAAFDYAKEAIGERRELRQILVANSNFNLEEFSKSWAAQVERNHKRKIELATLKQDKAQPNTFIIYETKAEDCPEVPPAPIRAKVEDDKS